ncbi:MULTISPECIES: ATP-binding cassette domain-containing protein [unclassified Streptococcus]|uniref:ATP-binding cassette domain-containing protein n=1 Tax=unclassified Streptococcus TaxID=2608887 RepID=UPI00069ECA16|nr:MULTISPECIES: ATP-binding cassette domain-containing protein [unclassified Streptococcus]
MTETLRLENIRKAYQDGQEKRVILDGVNLSLQPGEIIAILGPSGSGKSTLLSIIGCLLSADEGTIKLNGQDISDKKQKEWTKIRKESIGFIFQNHQLLPHLTMKDQLEMVAKMAKVQDVSEKIDHLLTDYLLKQADLTFEKVSNDLLKPYDLTHAQFKMIKYLYTVEGRLVIQKDIEQYFRMSSVTVARILVNLEKKVRNLDDQWTYRSPRLY